MDVPQPTGTTRVVVVDVHGRHLGLAVDSFLGHQDAYVRGLGFPFDRLSGLSGATIDGDGSVLFIVDPQTLLEGHAVVSGQRTLEETDAVS